MSIYHPTWCINCKLGSTVLESGFLPTSEGLALALAVVQEKLTGSRVFVFHGTN